MQNIGKYKKQLEDKKFEEHSTVALYIAFCVAVVILFSLTGNW
jgi:hypothetical protein